MDDDLEGFDFENYCIVCDKRVPAPAAPPWSDDPHSTTSANGPPAPSPALSAGAPERPRHKKTNSTHASAPKRTKSSSKLHHAGGGAARLKGNRSHTNLHGLQPSTAIHPPAEGKGKGKASPSAPATPDLSTAPAAPSSLYCSIECEQLDQTRSRLAMADLQQPAHTSAPDLASRRYSSSSSLALSPSQHSNSSFASFPRPNPPPRPHSATSPPLEQPPGMLDFSHRRNSRGHEAFGGYSYRPSLMQRVPSSEDGGSSGWLGSERGWARTTSSDSLASMGSEERTNNLHSAVRPPSALSSLRGMTPIGPPSASSPTRARFRPPNLARHNSDAPRPTQFRSDSTEESQERGRADEIIVGSVPMGKAQTTNGGGPDDKFGSASSKKINSPPLPSSAAYVGGGYSMPAPGGMGPLSDLKLHSATPIRVVPQRSASSASLALMGTSFGQSHGRSFKSAVTLAQPKRSESTASLSSLNAMGTIVAPTETSSPSTFIPPSRSTHPHHRQHQRPSAHSPSSPSSASSFAYSASTGRSSSFSSASGYNIVRGRAARGLQMTPSSSSLANAAVPAAGSWDERAPSSQRTPRSSVTAHGLDSDAEKTVRRASSRGPPHAGRTMSTPGRRPSVLPLIHPIAPTPPHPHAQHSHSHSHHPPNSSLVNPSLSYLVAPDATNPVRRNWSWDNLGVSTYHALDVEEVRREKGGDAAGPTKVSPTTPTAPKERKRLFHFGDDF